MVLLASSCFESANGLFGGEERGLDIEALKNSTLANLFFSLCKACQIKTMSCIPPSAFSAGRIRETQRDRDMKLSNTNKSRPSERDKIFTENMMELTPLKYNSKLMNSIWGFYNRYSPHNVKKINEALSFNVELPQSAGNSTTTRDKGDPVISLPPGKLEGVWAAINVSQSH